ncbi:hypothetical protein MIDIC_510014 [Alphaproteobacteria bacterium]
MLKRREYIVSLEKTHSKGALHIESEGSNPPFLPFLSVFLIPPRCPLLAMAIVLAGDVQYPLSAYIERLDGHTCLNPWASVNVCWCNRRLIYTHMFFITIQKLSTTFTADLSLFIMCHFRQNFIIQFFIFLPPCLISLFPQTCLLY